MKFDQGFATWSTKSLTQGDANGQGTVASSTSDRRFNRNLLAVESLFVRENSDEPVPFVMYARDFERFVSLGISPGKNYPGITTQNLLVHIVVPRTAKPWEAFAGCLVAPPFSGNLDDQDYMRTDLPVLETGEEDAAFFDIADILSEFGFNKDKNRLAYFLQRSVGAILSQSGALLIVLPDGNAQELRRQAARITWLIAMAMPKPADNTMRYIRNISYGVGTKDNAGKATVIYAGSGAADEARSNQVIHLDSYMAEKEEEEVLPVFRALSDKIVAFSRKNEDGYQLIRKLEEGRDPVWGDLQQISDARYNNSNNLTVSTLDMSYICWRLEDPVSRGHVSYDDIRDYYSGLLVQTKLGKKWHETMLLNYLKQEDTPDYQSVLALWKEVLSPALKRRDQFEKETWDEYLDLIVWCMNHVYDKSAKNYGVFFRQLKNDEDSEKVQLMLYEDGAEGTIIDKELAKIKSADDYRSFIDRYRLLCQRYPEVEQRAFAPVSFDVYIDPAETLEEREKISRKNLPGFSDLVEKYIKNFFTAERIGAFFKDELKRTESQYLSSADEHLYNYLNNTHNFWDDVKYHNILSDEKCKRNIRYDDPRFAELLTRKYNRELEQCTIDDLLKFPGSIQIDPMDNNGIDWYSPWQKRLFKVLEKANLTSSQFLKVCDACIDNELFSYLDDQETYKSLFHILWRAADRCVIDQSFSGGKTDIGVLRMIVQITWMEVCESNEWELEITEYDHDVWDWKDVQDKQDCIATWDCLSENDKYKILSFPEPQNLRGRISNQNLLRILTIIRDDGNVRDTLNIKGLENRYYYSRYETGNSQRLYLNDSACKYMHKLIIDKLGLVEESANAINKSAAVNVLSNLNWILSLFDTDVYWADSDKYRNLTPNQRRMYFYESFYHQFSQPFDTFIRLYNEYYQYLNRDEKYIRQGWRYNKLHEDYGEYQSNSEQIKNAVSNGVDNADWRRILNNLKRNLSEGKRDEMVSADIYKDTQNALLEIQDSLKSLKESLEYESSDVRNAKKENYENIVKADNLQGDLDNVRRTLEKRKKDLDEKGYKLQKKEGVGREYAEAIGVEFSGNFKTEPTNVNGNRPETVIERSRMMPDSRTNSEVTVNYTGSGNRPNKQAPKQSFSKICKEAGEQM